MLKIDAVGSNEREFLDGVFGDFISRREKREPQILGSLTGRWRPFPPYPSKHTFESNGRPEWRPYLSP